MKKYKYIENLTSHPIILGEHTLIAGTNGVSGTNGHNIVPITDSIETLKGYHDLIVSRNAGLVQLYDENYQQLTLQEFYNYWEFYNSTVVKYEGTAYKIYQFLNTESLVRFNDLRIVPKDIDYKIGLKQKLNPKYTFDKGFLVEAEYFESVTQMQDPMTGLPYFIYNNPILKVEVEYFWVVMVMFHIVLHVEVGKQPTINILVTLKKLLRCMIKLWLEMRVLEDEIILLIN